jgi:hypothetical protein
MSRLLLEALPLVAAATVLMMASVVGAPEALGAHPWWGPRAGLLGVAGGIAAYLILRACGLGCARLVLAAGATLILAALAATYGKRLFVASHADNMAAGYVWYSSWFVLAGAAVVLLAGVLARGLGR